MDTMLSALSTRYLRTSGVTMLAAILLCLIAVSWEGRYWSFPKVNNAITGKVEIPILQDNLPMSADAGTVFGMSVPQVGDADGESKVRTEDIDQLSQSDSKSSSTISKNNADDENTDKSGNGADESDNLDIPKSIRRSRAKTFLVVFMGHSGSTAFTTELRDHLELEVEFLEPLDHGEYANDTALALKRAEDLMDRGIAKKKIPGFKLRPFHIHNDPGKWRDFVKKYDTRIVWQYRENILKKAVGEYRHLYLNDSSVVQGLKPDQEPCEEGSDQKCRFRIDDMRFLHAQMNRVSRSDDVLSAAMRVLRRSDDTLIVRYEDYLYRRERTMRDTFDFFGLEYEDTTPAMQKASPDSLCEVVINYQELCDHFHPCPLWRPFLHDEVNDCHCQPGSWDKFDGSFCKREVWMKQK